MTMNILYEDDHLLVVDKPAQIVVFPEGNTTENTLIDQLISEKPELQQAGETPRYGIVHRLDKDTSGILLVAKDTETLIFLQKQFKNRRVEKKYLCLVEGRVKNGGSVKTLMGRSPSDPKKQTVYLEDKKHPESAREAITEYKVKESFKDYTLLEVSIATGRHHQIRCHLAFLQHPVAGDKLYSFKNSKTPEGLTRQFLHASYLKIQTPDGSVKEFVAPLPEELQTVISKLEKNDE